MEDNFASTDAAVNGVSVRLEDADVAGNTQLLDMTPGSSLRFLDSALAVGRTFTDPISGITIAVNGVDATGANVTVSDKPGGVTPPTAVSNIHVLAATPSLIWLTWNPATATVGPVTYRVDRDGKFLATAGLGFIDFYGLLPGSTHTWTITAVDGSSNAGPPTSFTATMPT